MSIISRHERQRLVLKLYNEGKTIREIAKEVRMSFRDIGIILNKVIKEKDKEGIKQQDNNDAEETNNRNSNNYLYHPKPTNSFLIERVR